MVGIFVLVTFLFCIVADVVVLKIQNKAHPAFENGIDDDQLLFNNFHINVPAGVFFSNAHSWVQESQYGLVKIGVDDFLFKTLGKPSLSNFAEINKEIKKGEPIFEISTGGYSVVVPSPINGKVKSINENILDGKINNPYLDWSVQIEPKNYEEDLKRLIQPKNSVFWMKNEFNRLKSFLKSNLQKENLAGVTMYDGGTVINGLVSFLPKKEFQAFKKEFLIL